MESTVPKERECACKVSEKELTAPLPGRIYNHHKRKGLEWEPGIQEGLRGSTLEGILLIGRMNAISSRTGAHSENPDTDHSGTNGQRSP